MIASSTPVTIRIALLGDNACGKTCLAKQFSSGAFNTEYQQTLGLDLYTKVIPLTSSLSSACKMEIWDVGGQTLTSKTATNYIHAVHAIAFVYDASRPGSLRTLEDWVQLVLGCKIITDTVLPLFVLVQTKNDISNALSSRPESRMQHQRFANEHNLPSFSVSAKSGDGVAELFRGIALDLCGVYRLRPSDVDQTDCYDAGGAERMTVVGAGLAAGSSTNLNDFSNSSGKGQLGDKEKTGCCVM